MRVALWIQCFLILICVRIAGVDSKDCLVVVKQRSTRGEASVTSGSFPNSTLDVAQTVGSIQS